MLTVLFVTSGNVRSQEMMHYWAQGDNNVIVFVDEAAKDLEANVWAGVVCEAWSNNVKGLFLFGDDK